MVAGLPESESIPLEEAGVPGFFELRFRLEAREDFLGAGAVMEALRALMRAWCGALPFATPVPVEVVAVRPVEVREPGVFFEGRVPGPAEEPREAPSRLLPLGVPGPREDWRREEDWAGRLAWWGLRRRRFGSVEGERVELLRTAARLWVVRGLFVVGVEERGEGWRWEAWVVLGWARRWMGLLAIVEEGPALPERGWSGVLVPGVVAEDRGGRRLEREVLVRRDGS